MAFVTVIWIFLDMSSVGVVFFVLNTVALLTLSRRYAPLPLLVGACYMTLGQGIELGPFNFTVIRMLVAVGIVRVIWRGERLQGHLNSLDWLMVAWAAWALTSSLLHRDPFGVLVNRLGIVYNACGVYFLLRVFCQSLEDVAILCCMTAILLAPLSVEMLFEKMVRYNFFSTFGGVQEILEIREGKIRAQGPFAHPILAGTVGAVCLPLMIGLLRQHRKTAIAGVAACFSMVLASASSGPILSLLAAIVALSMWHWRQRMRLVRWFAVLSCIALELVMKAPVYYLIARVNLVGGSTGWYRARLIESAIEHFSEWWLAGTDFTRHWMPFGVGWSGDHTDITNYYLRMGVDGGLPLMLLFIAILVKGFSFVGQTLGQTAGLPPEPRFLIWALGASLFAHAITFISVSYFDQSIVFLYLTLAAIGSVLPASAISKQS